MATYSNNTTMKVGSNISLSAVSGSSASATVPTGSYAKISHIYSAIFTSNATVTITFPNGIVKTYNGNHDVQFIPCLELSAGTTITCTTVGSKDAARAAGFLITNTP